jgi:hypothetical protein
MNLYRQNEYARAAIDERLSCREFTLRDLTNLRQNRPALLGIQLPWDHVYQGHPVGVEVHP